MGALDVVRIGRELCGEELQRGEWMKLGVLGFVGHAHAATIQFLKRGVMRDRLAEREKGTRSLLPFLTLRGFWRTCAYTTASESRV